ncbi:NAD(P)-binding protein [Suillus clintonianus]|uniref:NAD(P)-binding protein n=1 Tax=Suillus clintonianus TaxID=1904413 RepID=UPI001B880D22|nr:NAD(P)-binding protein [Suillus clintonianus]KAG2157418.1 NAD(P)-binding protein [Suillus clintonianus]
MSTGPTSNLPKTQRAWRAVKRGKPSESLVFQTDVVVPSLSPGEVLVKVQAAALNPVGWKVMSTVPNVLARRPITPEHDFAGVVVDANGTEFSAGDEVIGFIPVTLQLKTGQGALTEYTKLPAANLVLKPSNVSVIEACGLPLAGETAFQALVDIGNLQAGQSVFVNGGSSAVGMYAIYIAKALGAKVVTSASSRNEEFCRKAGADEFVDYTKKPLHEHFMENPPSPKFDIIFDAVGLTDTALYKSSNAYMKPKGVYISTGPWPDLKSWGGSTGVANLLSLGCEILRPSFLGGVNAKWTMVSVNHKPQDLAKLRDLVAEGKLKLVVDSVYGFEDVLSAYERIMTSRATGKVVVKVDDSL